MHNNFGLLSRGLASKRFVECLYEIKLFLNDQRVSYQELSDDNWVSKLTFFVNFCERLDDVNVNLLGLVRHLM